MCCFQGLEREESIPAENTSPRELGAACLHTLVEHSLSILCPGNWSGHRGQKLVEFCQIMAYVTCREPSMRRTLQQIHLKGDGEKKEIFFPKPMGSMMSSD